MITKQVCIDERVTTCLPSVFLSLDGLILHFHFYLLMAFLLEMSFILQEYIEENNGKSINLAHTTVKIPGKRPPKLTGELTVYFNP